MVTSYDNFYNKAGKKGSSASRYVKPKAVVYGNDRGVPFRLVFKSLKAAENLANSVFGSRLVLL